MYQVIGLVDLRELIERVEGLSKEVERLKKRVKDLERGRGICLDEREELVGKLFIGYLKGIWDWLNGEMFEVKRANGERIKRIFGEVVEGEDKVYLVGDVMSDFVEVAQDYLKVKISKRQVVRVLGDVGLLKKVRSYSGEERYTIGRRYRYLDDYLIVSSYEVDLEGFKRLDDLWKVEAIEIKDRVIPIRGEGKKEGLVSISSVEDWCPF